MTNVVRSNTACEKNARSTLHLHGDEGPGSAAQGQSCAKTQDPLYNYTEMRAQDRQPKTPHPRPEVDIKLPIVYTYRRCRLAQTDSEPCWAHVEAFRLRPDGQTVLTHLGVQYMVVGPAGNRRFGGFGRPPKPFQKVGGLAPHLLERFRWPPGSPNP